MSLELYGYVSRLKYSIQN